MWILNINTLRNIMITVLENKLVQMGRINFRTEY